MSDKEKENGSRVQGADGKACWKGYRFAGTTKGKDKCVKVKKRKTNLANASNNSKKYAIG